MIMPDDPRCLMLLTRYVGIRGLKQLAVRPRKWSVVASWVGSEGVINFHQAGAFAQIGNRKPAAFLSGTMNPKLYRARVMAT